MILDARKPRGKHIGCNLVHEIEPKKYVSTYQLDYTGLEKNKKLEIFSTAAKYNPYTWSNYTDMMNRRTKVLMHRKFRPFIDLDIISHNFLYIERHTILY